MVERKSGTKVIYLYLCKTRHEALRKLSEMLSFRSGFFLLTKKKIQDYLVKRVEVL